MADEKVNVSSEEKKAPVPRAFMVIMLLPALWTA